MLCINRILTRHFRHARETVSTLFHTDGIADIGSHVDTNSADYKVNRSWSLVQNQPGSGRQVSASGVPKVP